MNILDFIMVAMMILLLSLSLSIIFTWLMYMGNDDTNNLKKMMEDK